MQYVNYHEKAYFENEENCLTPFDKIIDYRYQKEFRVAIELESQNQVEFLNIGNIEKLGFICPSADVHKVFLDVVKHCLKFDTIKRIKDFEKSR